MHHPSRSPEASLTLDSIYASGDKDADISLLARYQRGMLWGGGIVLTLALLIAGALTIWSDIQEYISNSRSIYLSHKSLLLLEVETRQAALRRSVINAEEKIGANYQPPYFPHINLRDNGQGLLLTQEKLGKKQLILAQGDLLKRNTAAFAKWLALSHLQLSLDVDEHNQDALLSHTNYFMDVTGSYLSVTPYPNIATIKTILNPQGMQDLIRKVAPDMGDLSDIKHLRFLESSRHVTWFPPYHDPFSDRDVFRIAQLAFYDLKPLAVLVQSFPKRVFEDQLQRTPYGGNFMLIDQDGNLILSSWYDKINDPSLTKTVLDTGTWKENLHTSDFTYSAGSFTISEPLSDTGWILAYAYSWRTIIAARWSHISAYALGTLLLITLLWLLIIFFERRLFSPLLLRSRRVFESEILNRTIIATAPVGLSLVSLRDDAVILQNEVTHFYSGQSPRFPAQLLELYRNRKVDDSYGRAVAEEMEVCLFDGQNRHLWVIIVKAKYGGEDVLVCSFTDISIRKKLEEQLLEASKAAEAANQAKSTFLATMSHEIRTPLNGVLGNLELLDHSALTPLQRDRLQTIKGSSHALLHVINDVLDFSKIESGQMTLEKIRFNLLETIEQTIATFYPLADEKDLPLFYFYPTTLGQWHVGDVARLRQVLSNLMSNAIKFTERGKISIDLEQTEIKGAPGLTIHVTDTGIGIAPAALANLFKPFTQADVSTNRLFGGTGLGLALCKRLANLMGGDISIESTAGQGSRFSLHLPLLLSEQFEVPTDLSGISIDLLCSEKEWQTLLLPHLQSWGISVTLITHPTQAIQARPLMIFGSHRTWSLDDEEIARKQAQWLIDAREDGPRTPVEEASHACISCYALGNLSRLIARMNGSSHETETHVANIKALQSPQRFLRILVVEDHPVNLILIRDQLHMLGYQCALAKDGIEALAILKQEQFDLILSDLSMKLMDGYTLCRLLRSQAVALPIIAITAYASTDEIKRCNEAGITDILLKPTSLDDLQYMIGKHMNTVHVIAPESARVLSREMHALLQEVTQVSIAEIEEAIKQLQWKTICEQLHSIKGAFAIQKQVSVVNLCTSMENLAKLADITEMQTQLPLLKETIAKSLASL